MPDRKNVIELLECAKKIMHKGYVYRLIRPSVCDDALALLKEQDAKTGEWIEKEGYDGDTYYDCSACGESWMTIEGTPWINGMNYCPHCGAKMKGR